MSSSVIRRRARHGSWRSTPLRPRAVEVRHSHAAQTERRGAQTVFRDTLETTCAFEIDQIDEFYQSGWSVLALGGLHLLTEGGVRPRFGKIPEPRAAGPRSMFVQLPCVQPTGRRVIPGGR